MLKYTERIVHVHNVFPKIILLYPNVNSTLVNSRKRLHSAMRLLIHCQQQQQVSNTHDKVSLPFIFLQFVSNMLSIPQRYRTCFLFLV